MTLPSTAPKAVKPTVRVEAPPAPNRVTKVQHPLTQHALMLLRNKQTRPHEFRTASLQLLLTLLMEASEDYPTREDTLAWASQVQGHVLAKPMVFLTIGRDGLGFGQQVAGFFPATSIGRISIEPGAGDQSPQTRLNLCNAPALSDARVILFAPLVISGRSACRALSVVRRSGAKDVSIVCFAASKDGIEFITSHLPEITIWTAAIDPKLKDYDAFIPGGGNFVERFYR